MYVGAGLASARVQHNESKREKEMYKAKIYVTLKESVLDPQGKTIKHALESLDFAGVEDVRLGKYFVIRLDTEDENQAKENIENMCRKLLVNPVIETFSFDMEHVKEQA